MKIVRTSAIDKWRDRKYIISVGDDDEWELTISGTNISCGVMQLDGVGALCTLADENNWSIHDTIKHILTACQDHLDNNAGKFNCTVKVPFVLISNAFDSEEARVRNFRIEEEAHCFTDAVRNPNSSNDIKVWIMKINW